MKIYLNIELPVFLIDSMILPIYLTTFISYISLSNIYVYTNRTTFSLNRPKLHSIRFIVLIVIVVF